MRLRAIAQILESITIPEDLFRMEIEQSPLRHFVANLMRFRAMLTKIADLPILERQKADIASSSIAHSAMDRLQVSQEEWQRLSPLAAIIGATVVNVRSALKQLIPPDDPASVTVRL